MSNRSPIGQAVHAFQHGLGDALGPGGGKPLLNDVGLTAAHEIRVDDILARQNDVPHGFEFLYQLGSRDELGPADFRETVELATPLDECFQV